MMNKNAAKAVRPWAKTRIGFRPFTSTKTPKNITVKSSEAGYIATMTARVNASVSKNFLLPRTAIQRKAAALITKVAK